MSILVAYGTKMHGTEGLAEMVADELRTKGFEVDVTRGPARLATSTATTR